jgi:hypothetical protein
MGLYATEDGWTCAGENEYSDCCRDIHGSGWATRVRAMLLIQRATVRFPSQARLHASRCFADFTLVDIVWVVSDCP